MKKMGDVLPENTVKEIEKQECLVCECHKRAYESLTEKIECPNCGNLSMLKIEEFEVVGHSNYYDPKHEIGKYPTFQCNNCREYISLFPIKITYNANHDIYYTGGADYLENDENIIFKEAQKKIEISLRGWAKRIMEGEDLDSFYPALWLKRDLTKAIAEYLYEKGFKN